MRACVMREGGLVVDTVPDPVPGPGEVLVRTLACGICGSDLHFLRHASHLVDVQKRSGYPGAMSLERDVVLGHEFCAEIVDYGPRTERRLPAGTRVCSMPIVFGKRGGIEAVGYSNDYPGGYGELMVLSEPLLLRVPDEVPTEQAALTEPMAVGIHAVEKARLEKGEQPLVLGCGPVGLAVVAALRAKGVGPIVAADFSPARRELAEKLGADVVLDPGVDSPYRAWEELASAATRAEDPAPVTIHAGPSRRAVIFECVGIPGILQEIFERAPRYAKIVVVGVCMGEDRIEPLFGINKELEVRFVLGYTPDEFRQSLENIARGRTPVSALVTGKVGVAETPRAFRELEKPQKHAKILVEPWH
ncbi:MAG: alcohol dehydrogenase [Candidatus Binatia bacterium]|nr:MAG: alcohol dehydrogenase [Candidatus Binatia bacterium]